MAFISSVDFVPTPATLENGTTSVTVPAGAKLAIVGWAGFSGNSGDVPIMSGGTNTLGGTAFTFPNTTSETAQASFMSTLGYIINPSTGSQTFAWDYKNTGGVAGDGACFTIAFYDDVVTGLRAHAAGYNGSGSTSGSPFTTGSFASLSGDLVVAACGVYGGNDTFNWGGGVTSRSDVFSGATANLSVADMSASGSSTVTCWTTGGSDGSVVALAFAKSPKRVQGAHNTVDDGGGSTIAVTLNGVTAGNVICVHAFGYDGTGTLTCGDSASNTYTKQDELTGSGRHADFVAVATTGGNLTITATFSGAPGYRRIFASEYTNVDTAAPVNAHLAATSLTWPATTDAATTGSMTTTVAGCTIVGFYGNGDNATLPTAGTNFTSRDTLSNGAGDSWMTEDLVQNASGSIAATFTPGVANLNTWVAGIALKMGAGGVSPPTITVQPVSPAAQAVGTTFNFSLTASGATSYQWRKDGSNVSGGTGGTTNSYTTPTSVDADEGAAFDCVVTNADGSVVSARVSLWLTARSTNGKGLSLDSSWGAR